MLLTFVHRFDSPKMLAERKLLAYNIEVSPQHADKIARMLARLDEATRPQQLDLPGFASIR